MASKSGPSGGTEAVASPPDDLKVIAPFLQRANETRKADPPLSYWCGYHAAQMGIAKLGSLQPTSRTFLTSLLDSLEAQKRSLSGNDIVHGDDIVAKAHIENVALKVFAGADAEDRAGKASKATARRFLVAGNFIEVLTNFGALDPDMGERLKYAKWKAADIAKAIREGRQPTPGPADGLPEDEEGRNAGEGVPEDGSAAGIDAAAARLGGLAPDAGPLPSKDELDAEMARLTAGDTGGQHPVRAPSADGDQAGVAISPSIEHARSPGQPARFSFDAPRQSVDSPDGMRRNFSKPTRLSGYFGNGADGEVPAYTPNQEMPFDPAAAQGHTPAFSSHSSDHGNAGPASSAPPDPPRRSVSGGPRPPLPNPPSSSSLHAATRSPLPQPPSASFDGSAPSQPSMPSHFQQAPQFQPTAPPAFPPANIAIQHAPQAYAQPAAPPQAVPSAPPAMPPSTMPESLDHTQTARVQKLAKWAVSALDYDDVETARKQLREALDICEGRVPKPAR